MRKSYACLYNGENVSRNIRPSAQAHRGRLAWSGFSSSLLKSRFLSSFSPSIIDKESLNCHQKRKKNVITNWNLKSLVVNLIRKFNTITIIILSIFIVIGIIVIHKFTTVIILQKLLDYIRTAISSKGKWKLWGINDNLIRKFRLFARSALVAWKKKFLSKI